MTDPRGTLAPDFVSVTEASALRNPRRAFSATYHFVPGGGVADAQTTPAIDSSDWLDTHPAAIGEFARTRFMAWLWSPSGNAMHAAIFATNLITGVVTQLTTTVTTSVQYPTIFELGEFIPPESSTIALRLWSPSGDWAWCYCVLGYIRSSYWEAASYLDPGALNASIVAAPAYGPPPSIAQEVKIDTSLMGIWQPLIGPIVPNPANPEFVSVAWSGALDATGGNDQFIWHVQPTLNGVAPNYTSGLSSYENSQLYAGIDFYPAPDFSPTVATAIHMRSLPADRFGNGYPIDPAWVDPPDGAYSQDTASVIVAGDEIRVQANWNPDVGGTPSFYIDYVIVSYGIQGLTTTCDGSGRVVSYEGPMPAAIDHYEAAIYYGSGRTGTPVVLKEELGVITANPFAFPPQFEYDPATILPVHIGPALDGNYSFVIRAVYADGSYSAWSCDYTPPVTTPVFRTRHKAHA